MTIEMFDYGADIAIEVPALEDTTPLADVMGGLGLGARGRPPPATSPYPATPPPTGPHDSCSSTPARALPPSRWCKGSGTRTRAAATRSGSCLPGAGHRSP